ncbi:MAG TPA: DUF5680 domain-containing protein [Patescibacteria group bacterium]|nr:DUF5680 domain-containing protein [Patescibacteria group bacterium]
MPDSAALAAFLLRAKRATYAGQNDDATVTPLIPGSRQLEYREGERLYRDVYVGLTTFAGLETVDDTGAPRWAMTYAGGLVAPADFHAVYAFLRQALQRGDVEAPYRGPTRHTEAEWAYTNAWEGDLDRFAGAEAIERAGVVVYRLRYAGGRVR